MVRRWMNLGIVVVAGATAVSPAAAQTSSGSTPPATGAKPARKPVQNLQDEAKRPRDGEVVPGSASPETPAPAAPAATKPETPAPAPAPASTPAPAAPEKPAPAPAAKPSASTDGAKKSNASPTETKPAETPAKPKVRESAAATPTPTAAPRPNGTRPMQSPREFIAAGHQFVAYDVIAITIEAIDGQAALAQYRVMEDASGKPGPWQALEAGAVLRGRHELRTGAGVSVRLKVDEGVTCSVSALSRIGFERRVRSDGTSHPAANVVRGRATYHSSTESPWIVRTPDGLYSIPDSTVSFDADERTQITRPQ